VKGVGIGPDADDVAGGFTPQGADGRNQDYFSHGEIPALLQRRPATPFETLRAALCAYSDEVYVHHGPQTTECDVTWPPVALI